MSDTVKIIIEMSKEDYEFTKGAKTARYFPSEYYVNLILNGIPLDDLKAEIIEKSYRYFIDAVNDYSDEEVIDLSDVLFILDNIGKADMRGEK